MIDLIEGENETKLVSSMYEESYEEENENNYEKNEENEILHSLMMSIHENEKMIGH